MARRNRKPRPPLEVELSQFCFTGQVEGHSESRRVLAWGGLPGERVIVRERKRKKGTSFGVVDEVLRPATDRVEPEEDHFVCCSPWQVLDPSRELNLKRDLVQSHFEQVYDLVLPDFAVQGDVATGYRNKLEFGFTTIDDELSLSFFERGGPGRRIAIDGCCLGQPAINEAAAKLVQHCKDAGYEGRSLKSLMLRSNQAGEVLAGLYVRDELPPLLKDLQGMEPLVGFRMYLSNPKSPASVVDQVLQDIGRSEIDESLEGHPFSLSDRSFFQVNVPMFELALRAMREHVSIDRPVFDLYAGVGTIGISLGTDQIQFIEVDPQCTQRLHENCLRSGLKDPQIITAPAEKAITELPGEATIIVDPPRVGLHPKVVQRLIEYRPQRIVYLSCNPDTQARDLKELLQAYSLTEFRAFNFFPRTPHLETLAVLDR